MAPYEDLSFDRPGAVVPLTSDHGQAVLGAEGVLFGERPALNDHVIEAANDGIFERSERLIGFVGAGLPAAKDGVSGVPEGDVDEEAPPVM